MRKELVTSAMLLVPAAGIGDNIKSLEISGTFGDAMEEMGFGDAAGFNCRGRSDISGISRADNTTHPPIMVPEIGHLLACVPQ